MMYDDVVKEIADDLGYEEEELREAFTTFLSQPPALRVYEYDMDPALRAACLAVYVITKQRTAVRMACRSRDGWKERAISLGSPPHLLKGPR